MSAGASARMQPQGRFRIEGLAPGRYRLTARLLPGPQGSGPGASATADVDVSEGDVEGVEIRFQPPAVLTGRVVIEGPGAEAAKKQLQSLTVFMRGENWALAGSPAAVGEDGSFRTQLAFPGRHQIAVTGPAMSQLYTASIRTRSGVDAAAGLDIAAGSSEEVTIVLRTDGARLAVTRAASASSDESCGSYLAVVYSPSLSRLGAPFRSQALDAGGEAVFFPLPPGEYRVGGACVWNAVELAEPSFIERLVRDGTPVRLKPGEQARVEALELSVESRSRRIPRVRPHAVSLRGIDRERRRDLPGANWQPRWPAGRIAGDCSWRQRSAKCRRQAEEDAFQQWRPRVQSTELLSSDSPETSPPFARLHEEKPGQDRRVGLASPSSITSRCGSRLPPEGAEMAKRRIVEGLVGVQFRM